MIIIQHLNIFFGLLNGLAAFQAAMNGDPVYTFIHGGVSWLCFDIGIRGR